MSPPLPLASPVPPGVGEPDTRTKSGSHNLTSVREVMEIADQAVAKTARATRWQWLGLSFLGAVTVGVGAFLAWCLMTLGVIGQAQAQNAATAQQALKNTETNATRLEAIDGGGRLATERLERKIDANNEATDRKLAAQDAKLDLILKEVRKR